MLPNKGIVSNKDLTKIEHWAHPRSHGLVWSVTLVLCIMLSQRQSGNTKNAKMEGYWVIPWYQANQCKLQLPWNISFILVVLNQLNPTNPLHCAVKACILTVFFTATCLREFTILTLRSFIAAHHVKASDVFMDTDQNGLKSTGFYLPSSHKDRWPQGCILLGLGRENRSQSSFAKASHSEWTTTQWTSFCLQMQKWALSTD